MAYKDVEDRKAYHRDWYARNRVQRVEQILAYKKRELDKFRAYKAAQKCVICGYCRCVEALDFHHCEGAEKEFTINEMVRAHISFARVKKEIDKCCVLCANCHQEVHAGVICLPA